MKDWYDVLKKASSDSIESKSSIYKEEKDDYVSIKKVRLDINY